MAPAYLSYCSQLISNAHGRSAAITVGDLSDLCISRETIDATGGAGNRAIALETRASGELTFGEWVFADGSVAPTTDLQTLAGVAATLNLSYSQNVPTSVTFVNPVAQNYSISGAGNFLVADQSVRLNVTINGFGAQDSVIVDLPGGSINADLAQTSLGIIRVEGSSRGANAATANSVVVTTNAAQAAMQPDAGETVLAASLAERNAAKLDAQESATRAQDAAASEADSVLASCLAFSIEKPAMNDDSCEAENDSINATDHDEKTPENTEFSGVSEDGWGGIRTPGRITPTAVFKTTSRGP